MNPNSPPSSDLEEPTLDPQTQNVAEEENDQRDSTACKITEELRKEDQDENSGFDLNHPALEPTTGYRIVNGAICIDSEDDDDFDFYRGGEQNDHKRRKYTIAQEGKAKIGEGPDDDAECDGWLTLSLGIHQTGGQNLGSDSASASNSGIKNGIKSF